MSQENKSLLEQIYIGEFAPCETIIPQTPEYKQLVAQSSNAVDALIAELGCENRERLDTVLDLRNQLASTEGYTAFACGFRTGVRLIFELFLSDALPSCFRS